LEQLAQRLRSEHGVRVIEGLDLSTSGSGTALKQHVDAHGIVVEAFVVLSWQCSWMGSSTDRDSDRAASELEIVS
jgi:hypothetical protein